MDDISTWELMEFSNEKRFFDKKSFTDAKNEKEEMSIPDLNLMKIETESPVDRREFYISLHNMEENILRKVAQEAKEKLKKDKVYIKLKNFIEQIEIEVGDEIEKQYEVELIPLRQAMSEFFKKMDEEIRIKYEKQNKESEETRKKFIEERFINIDD